MRRARSRNRRIGLVAALSWVLAVVVTGAIAGRAVAALDASSPRTGLLSQDEVAGALATARAGALTTANASTTPTPTPSPTPTAPGPTAGASQSVPPTPTSPPRPHASATAHPTPPPTAAPPPTAQVVRAWTVTGGAVAASCRGAVISLLYATPQDGWTVDVGSTGPDRIKVELKRSDQETTLTAVCTAGVPTQTVTGPTTDHPTSGPDD